MEQPGTKKLPRPVLLIGSATALSLFGDQALYTILPTCADKLDLIPFQVGVILSINRWVRLLTNHLAERLVRRFSPTRLLLIALTLGALLTLVYSTRPTFVILLFARMLWGLCWSFIRQVGIMTSVDCSSERTKGRIIGLYDGIARTGSFVGMVVGGALYDLFRLTFGLGFKVGFSLTFAAFGVMSFLGLRLGAVARRGLRSHESVFRNPPEESKSDHVFGLLVCAFVIGCVGPGVIVSTLGFILKWHVGEDLAVLGVPIGVATLTGLLISSRYAINVFGAPTLGGAARPHRPPHGNGRRLLHRDAHSAGGDVHLERRRTGVPDPGVLRLCDVDQRRAHGRGGPVGIAGVRAVCVGVRPGLRRRPHPRVDDLRVRPLADPLVHDRLLFLRGRRTVRLPADAAREFRLAPRPGLTARTRRRR
ncbi:MAG: MFS transporter [Planctomycetota bacterium]